MRLFGPVKIDLTKVDVPKVIQPELLLHFPIPVVLHGLNPRLLLGKRWWNKTRKEAYRSNGGFCQACGTTGKLDAHERYEFDFKKLVATFKDVVPLCRRCHQYIHWLSCPLSVKSVVLNRGNKILWAAGFKIPAIKSSFAGHLKKYPPELCELQYTSDVLSGLWARDWKLDISDLNVKMSKISIDPNDAWRLIL